MPTVTVEGSESTIELHYDVFADGDRPWLVFAHGAGGNAACWWQQVPVFFATYNVITFDHRAFGRSRCSQGNFEPARFADDLQTILDAQGIERAGLVCQSMGGWTGLAFALANPQRTWALVMSHTVGGLVEDVMLEARRQLGDLAPPSEPFGSWAVAADLPQKNVQLAHLYNCIYRMNQDFLGFGGLSAFADQRTAVTAEQVAGFTVPTLFVTGDMDVVIPKQAVEAAHAQLAGSELVNLGSVGHSSYFEEADSFNEVVAGFLTRHAP